MTTVEIERVSAPPKEREDAREERERRAQVLEAAALEMEVRGRATNWTCNSRGQVCIGGAILFALGGSFPAPTRDFTNDEWNTVNDAWGNTLFYDAAAFNDSIAKSAAEVTFLLRWRAQELRDGWDTTRRVAALNPSPLNLEEAK